MSDIDMLNIPKVNIHAADAVQTKEIDNCCTNMDAIQRDDLKQETVKAEKCCTNINGISKSNNRIKPTIKQD